VRNGPQFWYFDVTPYAGTSKSSFSQIWWSRWEFGNSRTDEVIDWELPRYILQWNPQWGKKVVLTLLNDWNGRILDFLPPQATTEVSLSLHLEIVRNHASEQRPSRATLGICAGHKLTFW
jgi:hypothetical protein